ncbi:MAG: diacylglycerol/lipid kinase family protein [Candidatus Binatia bacterium]
MSSLARFARFQAHRRAVETPPSSAPVPARPAILRPFDSGRPIRVGAINNPASGRNLRSNGFQSILRAMGGTPGVPHYEVEQPADIEAATGRLAREGSEIIVVNGGDGTVQAVLTALFREPHLERFPLLAVLPGGTTNMIAGDVGTGQRPIRALEHLLGSARSGRLDGVVVRRAVMRVDVTPSAEPIFGMFFGAGAIYHGIRFCRQRIHPLGMRRDAGPGLALAVFLARAMLGRGGALFPPLQAWGRLDHEALAANAYFGILATTLERLLLGLRPFWGRGAGPLRYSALTYAPQHCVRAAWSVMRGRPNRYVRPEFGYVSRNVHEVLLHLDGGFTLDGELFTAEPGRPVVLRGGHSALFLRW